MSTNTYNASTAVKTVFVRELREHLLKKSSLITLIIMAVAAVGGIFVADYMTSKSDNDAVKIAVVGEAPFADSLAVATAEMKDANGSDSADAAAGAFATASLSPLEITSAADDKAARAAVTDGDADAALVPDTAEGREGSWKLLADDAPSWLAPMLQESLQKQNEAMLLSENGINPGEFFSKTQSAAVSVESLDEAKDEKMPAMLITLIGVMVMMTAILVFGGAVATSVIEEKSSRVIEIILSTVRPAHLLAGKILGAGLAGIIMMSVLTASAAVALMITGLAESFDVPWSAVWLLVPCFILGYFFFAALYAASASLVSRMEDFQGAQMPVLVFSLITMYVPLFGWSKLDSTVMQIASWIPPVSITTAPLQYAVGNFSALQLVASLLIMVVGVAAVIALAAWIYPRNVLRTGAAVSWKKALTAKS
ncbi:MULTISPECIES: ABC transporter permease [Corynebacterium]|uniref:ABC transporter permease n=1 Tax=Corynebacterium TaxID=1716 RepID=UPI0008A87C03|nr:MULTISPECIES: ABC transporter permease [Corynebacterium]MBC6763015.1 ABC transporter permease [Corynebacterium sp. LK27]MDK7111007.1 ABC transporter permease [Corynebacterium amycolatum]MDK7146171.1 ABC transporter permease [Corynebacterium amycolatum]OHR35271.1 ABC transporter permease [Corynebacterium sp. HMSC074C03]